MTEVNKSNETLIDDAQKQEVMSSMEDDHYGLVNEKGAYSVTSKPDIQYVTNEFLEKESKSHSVSVSEFTTQSSCTLNTQVRTMDTQDVDTSKTEKSEYFDNEFLDDLGEFQVKTQNNGDNIDMPVEAPSIKQYDPSIDNNLPETVTLLTTPDGGKLYLIGTAHFSIQSQNDVSKIIQAVQPHMVVVELCKARMGVMQLDEEAMFRQSQDLSIRSICDIMKEDGVYSGLLKVLMLRMSAHVAKELGMAPGGEFRRAFSEAKKVPNCIIHLGDRPINITIKRAVRSLSWWQTLKIVWQLLMSRDPINMSDVEQYRRKEYLEEVVSNIKKEFPVLGEVFVKERDIYLTYSLQLSCMPQRTPNGIVPARVVGVVGLGHTPGITELWGKVQPSDIPPVIRVPPMSLSTRILRFSIKASLIGAVVYIGYKAIPLPAGFTFNSIKSSVGGLLKVSVSR